MINKFFKRIHNKYSIFFKFIFFIRYLFVIFFTSLVLFLIIPTFFDYQKKTNFLSNYLIKNYGLKIIKLEKISYHPLPLPRIEIQNLEASLNKVSSNLFINKIILYPKLLNIYNFNNFEVKKIIINKSKIKLDIEETKNFLRNIVILKKKLNFEKLNIKLLNQDNILLNVSDVNYSNYGYKKNLFSGKIFEKKFSFKIDKEFEEVQLDLPSIGLKKFIKIYERENNLAKGYTKLKVLNSNLKFDFSISSKELKITNSYFRNKQLSFKNESVIIYQPYLETKTSFTINEIDPEILKKFNINDLLNSKNIIKKINSKNKISYKSKNFGKSIIDELTLDVDTDYGILNYQKTLKIKDNSFKCNGALNLLDEFPLLNFDCLIFAKNKKKFLKIFSIKYKDEKNSFKLSLQGNLNPKNNKINFKNINLNDYNAPKEDLDFFKSKFEKFFFNEGFLEIFNLKRIKNYILEVS